MRVRKLMIPAAAMAAATLAGCATTRPVEVTRFHLGTPIDRGTIEVQPFAPAGSASIEYKTYAAAVQTELMRLGYTAPAPGATAQYVATVNFTRGTRAAIDRGSPVRLGLGAGGFDGGRRGGGFGLGGGLSFGLGGGRSRDVLLTELSVQIKDHVTGTAMWEGRAQSEAKEGTPESSAAVAAPRLANALFKGFPGESGRTIQVK